jgi:hypothetical protein
MESTMTRVTFSKAAMTAIAKHRAAIDECAASIQKRVDNGEKFATVWCDEMVTKRPQLFRALRDADAFVIPLHEMRKAGRDYSDGRSGGMSYCESDRVGAQDGSTVFAPENDRGNSLADAVDFYTPESLDDEAGERIYTGTDADRSAGNVDYQRISEVAKSKLDDAADRIRAIDGGTKEQAFAKACQENNDLYKAWRGGGGGMTRVGGRK